MVASCLASGIQMSMIRLAHFVPVDFSENSQSTKMDILFSALFIANKWTSITEIQGIIKNQLGCIMAPGELNELIRMGVESQSIINHRQNYNLHPDLRTRMTIARTQTESNKINAFNSWIRSVISPTYGELPQDIRNELQEKLVEFVTNICLAHGVSTLSLIEGDIEEPEFLSVQEILNSLQFEHKRSREIVLFGKLIAPAKVKIYEPWGGSAPNPEVYRHCSPQG